jgi:hypothetical protein
MHPPLQSPSFDNIQVDLWNALERSLETIYFMEFDQANKKPQIDLLCQLLPPRGGHFDQSGIPPGQKLTQQVNLPGQIS